MSLSHGASSILATTLSLIIFATLQVFKSYIVTSKLLTILGGFISSFTFILLLTAFNNCEQLLFGKGFQSQIFPEVVVSLVLSCIVAGMVHRICITVCFFFSLVGLYYLNKLSQKSYSVPAVAPSLKTSKKKK